MPILKDTTTGETYRIHICYQCDPEQYPKGKPIDITDWKARKDEKGNWVCGECQIEDINKRKLRMLGPNHPEVQAFIKEEDKQVRQHNDAARRLNQVSGQYLMK